MTLYRTVFLLAFAVASSSALAADPNVLPATPDASSVNLDSIRLVPWFTGTKRASSRTSDVSFQALRRRGPILLTPGAWNEVSCLALRTYKVKRTERLADNESASRGYTTCQPVSNYQIRTAVGTQEMQVPPQ